MWNKLALLMLTVFIQMPAVALPNPNPSQPRLFDLMKCTSAKQGTLWGSFGHLMRSDSDQIRFFPTELVLFEKDFSARLLFPTLEEALKIDMNVGRGRVRLEFSVMKNGVAQKHLLQLMQYNLEIDNAYLGNWTVSEADQVLSMDQAACTLN